MMPIILPAVRPSFTASQRMVLDVAAAGFESENSFISSAHIGGTQLGRPFGLLSGK
jgi:hypothetical protein